MSSTVAGGQWDLWQATTAFWRAASAVLLLQRATKDGRRASGACVGVVRAARAARAMRQGRKDGVLRCRCRRRSAMGGSMQLGATEARGRPRRCADGYGRRSPSVVREKTAGAVDRG